MVALYRSTMAALLACLWLALPSLAQLPPMGSALRRDRADSIQPTARNNFGFVNYASIMDPAFGAKCDGATDDAAAIQAAAASLTLGGVLLIPAGENCHFNTTITLQQAVTVKSEGAQAGHLF